MSSLKYLSWLLVIPIMLLLLWPSLALAQNQAGASGRWEGMIDVQVAKLGLTLDLSQKEDGAWTGTIAIPAQGLKDFSLKNVTVKGSDVSFNMPEVQGEPTFKGKLSEDGKVISGDVTQSGRTFPFKLERKTGDKSEPAWQKAYGPTPEKGMPGESLEGIWQGTLDAGGTHLRLVLKVAKVSEGAFTARVDSPDQSVMDLPVDDITLKDKSLRFEMKRLSGVYEGTLGSDGSEVSGQWQQGGASLPLTFKRLDKKAEPR